MFKLPYIPSADKMLDEAFRIGAREARKVKSTRKPHDIRMRLTDEKRIEVVSSRLCGELNAIITQFPSYENLPPFYQKLFDVVVDRNKYKKSLGALSWVCKKLKALERNSVRTVHRGLPDASNHFLGRTSSYVKRVEGELDYLNGVSRVLASFPVVKELPTLVVAGYPNVGKSTFVRNLTGSKVEVASYPFTTKGILVGYVKKRHQSIQVIDSPGLLDRPMGERNSIELQAVLALRELAGRVFFIVDPSVDVDPQLRLLREVRDVFLLDVVVGVNKVDAVSAGVVDGVVESLEGFDCVRFSADSPEDCMRVFERIWVS